ncbi:MAG: type II toxin-antitoxin system Phd/YefM family antitoxin [Anaerolineales bacterium]|nr:type II toxin-antitoxin system Phd/YefM family antitoxin [Anaerolineales bacterium]MCB8953593.1 type II toxin-antitoxin system Phd/YefM family antitoxin [Ardenticatenales bacterium]
MQKVIGVTELQRRFRSVFDEVAHDNVPYVLTRGSRPEAALIPYETFLHLLELQEDELLAEFNRLAARVAEQNADYSEAEVEADVVAAIAESRRDTSRR